MTPDQAMQLARFQVPGVKVVVGPTAVRIERIAPLSPVRLDELPGDHSWHERDLRLRLGFVPSAWAQSFGGAASRHFGHDVTDAEWRWLHGQQSSLETVRSWLSDIAATFSGKEA
jgi:hypothetical protein